MRLPAEFSDRVPNIDLSTYEQDGKVTSISDWMQANGLDRKSHWSEILEVLHSEVFFVLSVFLMVKRVKATEHVVLVLHTGHDNYT